ncbi:MAG: DUF4062 domain-containing protein [Chloroflexi bacterium]|nr:DUF4062 domain-containing protein [Chloroflexota bacterium]
MKTFLSSTYIDLVEHRKAATEALERLGQQVGRMEIFGSQPLEPTQVALAEIATCDLFVGIYAYRYGCIPAGSLSSITEQEFDYAKKLNKPLFCFLVDEEHPWPPKMIEDEPGKTKLHSFKAKISSGLVRDTFTTPEDLAFKVAASVGRYLTEEQPSKVSQNPYVALLRQSDDLATFLEKAVRELENITQTDYNQVFLMTSSTYSRQLVAVADVIPPHKQRYRIATFAGLLGSAVSTGKTLNVQKVRERPNYVQAVLETESELVVPISTAGAVFGVLNSESEEASHYKEEIRRQVENLSAAIGELLPTFGWYPSMSVDHLPWIHRLPK